MNKNDIFKSDIEKYFSTYDSSRICHIIMEDLTRDNNIVCNQDMCPGNTDNGSCTCKFNRLLNSRLPENYNE
jgi:hypothetical protein